LLSELNYDFFTDYLIYWLLIICILLRYHSYKSMIQQWS